MTTVTLWIVVIIAFGFGLMFIVTFLQMLNVNKCIKELTDVMECLWVTLGYLDKNEMNKAINSVSKRTKKTLESVSSKK